MGNLITHYYVLNNLEKKEYISIDLKLQGWNIIYKNNYPKYFNIYNGKYSDDYPKLNNDYYYYYNLYNENIIENKHLILILENMLKKEDISSRDIYSINVIIKELNNSDSELERYLCC